MKKTTCWRTVLSLLLLLALPGGDGAEGVDAMLPPVEGAPIVAADYSIVANWAVAEKPDKSADVFLLYPTAYQGEAPLAEIGDEGMRAGADNWLKASGSAFETAGNLYMPYYRQLDAMWALTQPVDKQTAYQRGVPKTDVLAAFDYYLKNYNNGRPFILASHSQGSTMAKEILFDYFKEHPEAASRMIAAYVIGYSVTEADFTRNPDMRFASGADDTGVILSYNTVTPDAQPLPGSVILPGSMAINPISWTRTDTPAPAGDNLGSWMHVDDGYKKVMGLADATVKTIGDDYEVVVCSTADVTVYGVPCEMSPALGMGSFHTNDIQFYYYNLRENAERRLQTYFQNH